MPKTSTDQRFRLTASAVASYFKHRCDRLFRWNTVERGNRGRPGIGWNVPAKMRAHSRPGIALLMQAGDEFELGNIDRLVEEAGRDEVHFQKETSGSREIVRSLPVSEFIALCVQPTMPRYIAQIEIIFSPEQEERFLRRFDLDPARVRLGPARPDLIEVIEPSCESGKRRLRVWDFKGSQIARHEHFIQVAYYSFLLEHLLEESALSGFEVDTEFGVIVSRKEDLEFELRPYRLAVTDFLRTRAQTLFATPAADTHYHVREQCSMCEYMDTCRAEADAGSDLSRIAYMSSESKRKLRQAGIMSHRDLARLEIGNGDALLVERLRAASHDLSTHLPRYIATAKALEDGAPRPLESSTLMMPRYEDIRVILSAEQDAVTGTCFAVGMKTFEGWDTEAKRVIGSEQVFLSDTPGGEGWMLLEFLTALNSFLHRVDEENGAIAERPIDEETGVVEARSAQDDAEMALASFKEKHNPLRKTHPDYNSLLAQRNRLEEEVKQAKKNCREAERNARWELTKQQRRLHFYLYDNLDLLALEGMVERHLFDEERPELLEEIRNLVRLFPPSSVMKDADTFRTVPGTVVTRVLQTMVALPAPYLYDLRTVSELYQPHNADGEEKGYTFRPRYGFGWEHSNQVAFERIHDVWNNESFIPDPKERSRDMSPRDILATIEETVKAKLRATDSIIRRLKEDLASQLLLRKEPFRLHGEFDPIEFRMIEALRVFTMLEASLDELQIKSDHTLPIGERAAKFVCIRGMRYVEDGEENSLWFTFDPECRDARFDAGDFNLVVTPEDEPGLLMGEIDGKLYERAGWKHANFRVRLVEYDLASDPPRVRLCPEAPSKFRESIDLTKPCVLDQLFVDYNSSRVLDVLARLHAAPEEARHIQQLTADGSVEGWSPFVTDSAPIERELRHRIAAAGLDAGAILNPGQWKAWHGVFREPLTLIWGPPGTGKTHTVAHILLGYALAARSLGRPLSILVTAFTHHAIANVLKKVAELADRYGIGSEWLAITKLGKENAADSELPKRVERRSEEEPAGYLAREQGCTIAGATVWAIHKGMKKAGGAIRPWFDLVLIDEASQMRLPDALIAFSASRPTANIILAGDDRQLPPIIHGTYPEEHEHMLSSVFAFMRDRMNVRSTIQPDAEERMLFQLEENFRMSEPLTAYPREILYRGRFSSTKPHIRIATTSSLDRGSVDPVEAMLHPDRPAVLCWYTSPQSFTSRNPIEADLVARLASRLAEILVDERSGVLYTPAEFAARGLASLSPHRAQNSTIRQRLASCGFGTESRPLPLVDTVEKLQGQERDVVLVSYGVADEEYADAEGEFLLSSNRFNVAATRARHKLILLCSDTVLDVVPDDREILLESMMLKEFRTYCSDGSMQLPWNTEEFGEVTLNIRWKGFDGE
jgi:hypothetical protein